MTGKLSKNFHGVGIGPLSNILAVNSTAQVHKSSYFIAQPMGLKDFSVKFLLSLPILLVLPCLILGYFHHGCSLLCHGWNTQSIFKIAFYHASKVIFLHLYN